MPRCFLCDFTSSLMGLACPEQGGNTFPNNKHYLMFAVHTKCSINATTRSMNLINGKSYLNSPHIFYWIKICNKWCWSQQTDRWSMKQFGCAPLGQEFRINRSLSQCLCFLDGDWWLLDGFLLFLLPFGWLFLLFLSSFIK